MAKVTYHPVPSTLIYYVRGYERWNVINTCVQRDECPKHRKRPSILLCKGRGPEACGVCQMEWWGGGGGEVSRKTFVCLFGYFRVLLQLYEWDTAMLFIGPLW